MDDETQEIPSRAGRRGAYRSLGELMEPDPGAGLPSGRQDEFPPGADLPPEVPAGGLSRRRFLSLVSASAALAVGATACSRIDRGLIVPYTKRPEEILPGVANYYASTFQEGIFTHGVLVKTREGRPILVEGNEEHPLTRGKAPLRALADVLGLYDPDRLRRPSADGAATTWEKADQEIVRVLRSARDGGKPLLLLTGAVVSPTCRALIEDLKKTLPSLRHASWEPAAPLSALQAARALYGEAVIPRPRLDRATVILSLQADFLGANSEAFGSIRDFAARRALSHPGEAMNRLWALEGSMTLTGANADQRIQVRPAKIAPLAFALARTLSESQGVPLPSGLAAGALRPFDLAALARDLGIDRSVLEALANDLKRAESSALVIAGPVLPPEAHVACQLLNVMLGAEGNTLDASLAPAAPDLLTPAGLRDLLGEAASGTFAAAIFWDANPAYDFPEPAAWKGAVAKIPLKIRVGLHEDETALDCRFRLPENHWLEGWGDFEPALDLLSLRQPTIGAIHDTRQGEEILLAWARALGLQAPPAYSGYLRARWQKEVYPEGTPVLFGDFWNAALHDGVLQRPATARPARAPRAAAFEEAIASASRASAPGDLELVLAPGTGVYDGRYANSGWLNELPDPVTKATWGNPLLLSIADAERLGVKDEQLVTISARGASIEAPVVLQPGQAPGVAYLALGHGRRTGNVAAGIGSNAYLLMDPASASPNLVPGVTIARTGGHRIVPRTQEHFRMEGRDPARSWSLEEYARRAGEGAREEKEPVSLIPPVPYPGPKWGMAIDLSACIGCSACMIACQSENNIPVVGPQRVAVSREMHWIRIDRYYEGDPADPAVVHQPILCQHCDNAPCEIVCPVNATTHSPDGLNQMAYNRCVGTRYCSNNCPYKVRRFNYFDYTAMKKEPESLVFNPEVTVRPRGVMEKCTFCIQRIEDVKLRAKAEDRRVRDGEIRPACAVACPAEAIVFGDVHDPESHVSRLLKSDRGYRLLEELGVKPSVKYLVDLSNPASGKGKA